MLRFPVFFRDISARSKHRKLLTAWAEHKEISVTRRLAFPPEADLPLAWPRPTRRKRGGWASENGSMNNVSLRTLAKGVRRMKGKRRTTEEKIRILRQADGERTILEICAENNISEQTFHRWKKEFGLLDVKQAKRLKEREAENTRLKRIVADQVPGMEIIQEALEKKL